MRLFCCWQTKKVKDSSTQTIDFESKMECIICYTALKTHMFEKCKHVCLCSDCANEYNVSKFGCPVCRQSEQQIIRVYV